MRVVTVTDQPPEWVRKLSRSDLENLFGTTTVRRGVTYQRRRAVRDLSYGPDGESLVATVQGTQRYTTIVTPECDGSNPFVSGIEVELSSDCSCPMEYSCKHVVAVVLEAQSRRDPARGAAGRGVAAPSWQALLDPVLHAEDHTAGAPDTTPLALLIDVVRDSRPGGGSIPRLQLRPLVPGASGGWIRTGISWADLQYSYTGRRVNPVHREALAAIYTAERVRSSSYYSASQWISADQVGPRIWGLLEDASAAGVTLVTGQKGAREARIANDPATVLIDTTRSASGDLTVRPRLRIPGVEGAPVPVGAPAHGVFVQAQSGLTLARLDHTLTAPLATLVGNVGTLTIPAADADRFLTHYYPALRQRATVESPDGSVDFPAVQPPRLAVHVAFEDDHRTRLRWTFRYTVGHESTDAPLLPAGAAPGAPADALAMVRDAAAEEALLESLEMLDGAPGLRVPRPGRTRLGVVVDPVLEGWATVAFVRDVLPGLLERHDIDVTVVGTPLDYTEADCTPVVTVSTHDLEPAPQGELDLDLGTGLAGDDGPQEDWFDLGIVVTVAGEEVPLASLLTSLGRGDEQLILGSGTWFPLDIPELHALRRIVEEARALQDHESEGLRINRYQAGLWEELVALGVVAHQSERWAQSVGALLALEELPHPDPPSALDATLRPYQLDGYQWLSFLREHRLGGILADDMGLGKTLQTLTMAERAREDGLLTAEAPLLVVAPTSVVGAWLREAEKFTPKLTVAAVTQTMHRSGLSLADAIDGAHVVVTSYALFRIDEEHYTGHEWGGLVLDEAQFVKNHQSKTYQVARRLRAPVKLAITGTPLENSLMDLWALLSIVAPGLFPTPQRFGELYRKPIESGESPELLATLRRRIRPLMLRRTKESVAVDLPPKVEQLVPVTLNPQHRRVYDTHLHRERQRILGLLDDVDRNRIAILTALTKLRQLSLDVHLVEPEASSRIRSSKVDALLDQLVSVAAEGHRCLVFSQFTRFLGIVRQRLVAEGLEHVYLDGRTRNRPKRIAEFTEGDAPVFLISLKAGGSGLTLTEADYVFVLDPWWNPAVEAQAVDRAHRIGQDKTVMVYRLVSEGTIEEKVVALQERKRDLFARVVDDGGLMGAPLSADDIRGLLEG
ncbi:MAG: DEAD/DEAH box helicase [Intrasporangium sp.]|uniref:DEAD/DEAH box helicase n=1 Tax=Intrasporangium sp. TaxID=1925024 RepID=UPI002647EAAA|nr:DEAD/DEAH box helicase [Intrasporangium sp.]MDN5795696.1 DEAD/DEAH box helicase [Intrasporangium sp.]